MYYAVCERILLTPGQPWSANAPRSDVDLMFPIRRHRGLASRLCVSSILSNKRLCAHQTRETLCAVQDKKLLMWDVRTCQAQGVMKTPGQPLACFDEEGLVFAVGVNSGLINLYDARNYSVGPFSNFRVDPGVSGSPQTSPFSCLKFSPDGKWLLAVADGALLLLDAFEGTVVRRWDTGAPSGAVPMEASFSCDGTLVLSGMPSAFLLHSLQSPPSGAWPLSLLKCAIPIFSFFLALCHSAWPCFAFVMSRDDVDGVRR